MVHKFLNGIPVTYYKPAEAKGIPEFVTQKFPVCRSRNPFKVVERTHYAACSRIYGGLVNGQILVTEHGPGHVHGIVITAGLGGPVSREMLYACEDGGVGPKVFSLITPHHCLRYAGRKEGVFSGAFGNAAPAGVGADIAHGRECPGNPEGRCFKGRNPCELFHGVHVPGAGDANVFRENGSASVDDVVAENDGNPKP